ncbi:MAG: hypothetical protein JRJ84_20535 [Deltaproteobacteria bacterium]|nr:hypothetical protein [Deltaproteobacteria bacterium]
MQVQQTEYGALGLQLVPRIRPPGDGSGIDLVPGVLGIDLMLEAHGIAIPVTHEDLAKWGTTFDQAYPMALNNLRARSQNEVWEPVPAVPGMQLYRSGDKNAAARALLLPELFQDFPREGVLFSIPSPGRLLTICLWNFESLRALPHLESVTRVVHKRAREPLSDQVFWADGENIQHLLLDEELEDVRPPHAFLRAVERLATASFQSVPAEA